MSPQFSSGTSGDGGSLQTCQDLEDLLKSQNSTYTEGELKNSRSMNFSSWSTQSTNFQLSWNSKYSQKLQCRYPLSKFAGKRIPTARIFLPDILPLADSPTGKIISRFMIESDEDKTDKIRFFIISNSFHAC